MSVNKARMQPNQPLTCVCVLNKRPPTHRLAAGAEFIAGGGNAKAASKNAKRRAKKKAGEASGEGDEGEEAGGAEGAEAATAALASSSLQV